MLTRTLALTLTLTPTRARARASTLALALSLSLSLVLALSLSLVLALALALTSWLVPGGGRASAAALLGVAWLAARWLPTLVTTPLVEACAALAPLHWYALP